MSNQQDDQPDSAAEQRQSAPEVPNPPAYHPTDSAAEQRQSAPEVPNPPAYHPTELDPHLAYMPLRSYGAIMALAFFFPIHFFFVRKIGLGIAFWATMLIGWLLLLIPHLIWWFVSLFLVKRWVLEYNEAILDARRHTVMVDSPRW